MSMATSQSSKKLRVFLIPFFATGHIIPISQLARLLSSHPEVEPTILLTPANADLVRPSLALSPSVHLLTYPFPASELDLPPGAENIASVPSSEARKFDKAVTLVRATLDPILHSHRPDAIIADFHYWWALHTAADLSIPCLNFIVVGAFPQLVLGAIQDIEADGDGAVALPGLPGQPIVMPRSELPGHARSGDKEEEFNDVLNKATEAAPLRFGAIVHTFYGLEPDYCDHFRSLAWFQRTWYVGPLAVATGDGSAAAESGAPCLRWLQKQKAESVVYVCFGSWCHFSTEQLRELAVGLEASGRPFLWVVRGGGNENESWLPEGWEHRVDGMLVRGWAPQVEILSHPSVGAFLTHCGWNSVLEGAAAGVPMLTWPLVVEQFINERLVVEVMGAGARVWDGYRSTEEEERVVVPSKAIGRAVAGFMDAGGSGEAARRKAREYAAMAKAAVAEGGSSQVDLHLMIDVLMAKAGMGGN